MASIKQRIRTAILEALSNLKNEAGVRTVSRHRDLIATTHLRPALLVIDTGEFEKARDATGQTYEFDLYVKVLVDDKPTADEEKDNLVSAVQAKLENIAALAGLATYLCGGEEKMAITARFVYIDGPFVRFRFQYKRKKGLPGETY